MHDHDPNVPDLARRVAAFLEDDAASLPAVHSAWIYDSRTGPRAYLYLDSDGPAAYRDLSRWADTFDAPVEITRSDQPGVRYARTVLTAGGITYEINAIINGTGNSTAAGADDAGHQEAA